MLFDPKKVSKWNYHKFLLNISIAKQQCVSIYAICRQDGATVDRGVKIREEANQLLLVLSLVKLRCGYLVGHVEDFFTRKRGEKGGRLPPGWWFPTAEEGNVEDLAWNLKKVEEFLAKAQEEARQLGEAEKRRSLGNRVEGPTLGLFMEVIFEGLGFFLFDLLSSVQKIIGCIYPCLMWLTFFTSCWLGHRPYQSIRYHPKWNIGLKTWGIPVEYLGIPVTTRIIPFLVGNPNQNLTFVTGILGGRPREYPSILIWRKHTMTRKFTFLTFSCPRRTLTTTSHCQS